MPVPGHEAPEFIPVTLDTEALHTFRRPFTPEAIRWKVQATWPKETPKKGALLVAYIDARLVIERLNYVTALWEDSYRDMDAGVECRLTVCGVTRTDVGVGQGAADVVLKAGRSDALKRAAVKFGIGISLYSLPKQRLQVGSGNANLRLNGKGDPVIDDRTESALRAWYAKWLELSGEEMFGPALDHGDQAGAVGDPDVETPDVSSEEPAGASAGLFEPTMGPAVAAAVQDLRAAYDALERRCQLQGMQRPMLPAEFNRLAREAIGASSEDDIGPLVELTAKLEKLP